MDDGSRPGIHDLEIQYPDRPAGAVEVTAAADAESIELWKIVNEREGRLLIDGLAGGWMVHLSPYARGRRVLAELPDLLLKMEAEGISRQAVLMGDFGRFEDTISDLGITGLMWGDTDYPGSIYMTIDLPPERSGGAVGWSGNPLAVWLGNWIREPAQAHNLEKLTNSGADERHFFIVLPGFTTAPFPVSYLLSSEEPPLPHVAPDLPPEVTHVWTMSTWNVGIGMRWSPTEEWKGFDKLLGDRRKK